MEPKNAILSNVIDVSRTRVHLTLISRVDVHFEYAHFIVLKNDLVHLGRSGYGIIWVFSLEGHLNIS